MQTTITERNVDIFTTSFGVYPIKGTLVYPTNEPFAAPAVLLFHGWGVNSNRTSYVLRARRFAEKGAVCLAIDFPGHGESRPWIISRVSRSDALVAALAAYDFLCNAYEFTGTQIVDTKRVSGFGRSFGAYILAILSGLRRFQWLHLGIPASYPDSGFWAPKDSLDRKAVAAYRDQQHRPEEDLALGALAQFGNPVNIVSSGRDNRVPERTVQNYLDAAQGFAEHLRIQEAPHHGLTPEQEEEMMSFALDSWARHCLTP